MKSKKPSFEDYQIFLEKKILSFGLPQLNHYYQGVVYPMKFDFENGVFFKQLNDNLQRFNEDYTMKTKYRLFSKAEKVELKIKPFKSMIDKCYRFDVINNPKWKEEEFGLESDYQWMNPIDCFTGFDDILRTRISVRYIDGAVFILERLEALADSLKLSHRRKYKAEEEGYYAIHFYLKYPFEIPTTKFETKKIESEIEIQVITEVQDLIVDLTHKYYEERRDRPKSADEKWQWNYDCDEFIPNYLGHIVHYIGGMIMEVRKRRDKEVEI